MVFQVVMYRCEIWIIKKAELQRIDAFELWCWRRLLRVPYSKEIKPVNPKGNQSWIFIGRTDEAETPILWPPDAKNWLIGKDPDAGKDWRRRQKEDEMVGGHHWLAGHDFEQAPGVGDGQGSLVCCSPWGGKESETIEHLNWTKLNRKLRQPSSVCFLGHPELIFNTFFCLERNICLILELTIVMFLLSDCAQFSSPWNLWTIQPALFLL